MPGPRLSGRAPPLKGLDDQGGDPKRKEAAQAETGVPFRPVKPQPPSSFLQGPGHFGAPQDDHPAQLEPDEEEGQGGEASIYGIVLGHSHLKMNVDPLGDLVEGSPRTPPARAAGRLTLRFGMRM